jgi:tRNA dimethylallyltransferase
MVSDEGVDRLLELVSEKQAEIQMESDGSEPSKGVTYRPALVAIGGPTATGKSGLGVALSQRFNGVILSADSRQVYREFDIGTAKPSVSEQLQVPHALIDCCDPTETLTVAEFQQQAIALIETLHQGGQALPLLVGGTGLYLKSVVRGLQFPRVPPQPELRSQLSHLGQPHCHALLQQVDPVAGQRIHLNDAVRTLRALEVFYATGIPLSAQQQEQPPTYPILYIGLDCTEPDNLRQRIARRTQVMIDAGLVAEVATLMDRYGADLPLLNTLGYAEVRSHLQGNHSLATAIELITQHTCQFAKRQRTWFRRVPDIEWFDADSPDLLDQVSHRLERFLKFSQI